MGIFRCEYRRTTTLLVPMLVSLLGCSGGDGNTALGADGGMPDGSVTQGSGGSTVPGGCLAGQIQCDGSVAKVCDGKGGFSKTEDCSDMGRACLPSTTSLVTGQSLIRGCVACTPGEGSCSDGKARYCPEDGSGFIDFECDSVQGMTCEADGCKGACALPEATFSYIGCEYYPTVTLNPVWQGFDFAVSVANTGSATANVRIDQGDTMITSTSVSPGDTAIVPLPWHPGLKGGDVDACQVTPDPGATLAADGAAYRLRSDQPVTVHQFSPLQYALTEADGSAPAGCPVGAICSPDFGTEQCLSYSNDASLLLPVTSLTGDYTVLSWPSAGASASFYTITATADGTVVNLSQVGRVSAGHGVATTGESRVTLDRGDVLQVIAEHGGTGNDDLDQDTAGARVRANKPVQVIGGNSCALIPDRDTGECDHVEQALFPSQILGQRYVASFPAAPASESPHVLRLAAIEADTHVTFDPPLFAPLTLQPGQAPKTLRVGSYSASDSEAPVDLYIESDKPLSVAQFMQGQTSVESGAGDPSMALAVPVEQFRDNYVFVASQTYDDNFINVISEGQINVTLDGTRVSATATEVGDSGFYVRRVELPSSDKDVHRITASAPFGVIVYGYGRYTSYMYPGGLDLKRITVIPPE